MAKGLDKHKARLDALSLFGKDLTRRAGSCCELCDASGTKLNIFEVPPVPSEPEFEHCIFICDTCSTQIDNPKRRDSDHWRCLNKSAWSQVLPVQVMAVHMLDQLQDCEWAKDLREMLYLEPEVQAWLDKF